jgi:xanthine dehydrogenase YagR molybdenum-binding subunit
MATAWPEKRRVIGTRVERLDGPAKATGKARYSFDVNRNGMLHARILRCPHAHAKVKKLDLSAAEKVPGVKAFYPVNVAYEGTFVRGTADGGILVTVKVKGADVEKTVPVGKGVVLTRDGKVVTPGDLKEKDKVYITSMNDLVGKEYFYAGDEVLGLAADTEEHAADALRAIKIEYDELPFLVREDDALKVDKKTAPPVGPKEERENIRPAQEGKTAGFEKGLEAAAAVVEGVYGVATICHQCLESHGLVAEWGADGGLTVWASTQAVFGTAQALSRYFQAQKIDLPENKVKCITHYMGGGFGSKFGPDIQGTVCAELARRAGAPVKLMLDRAEEATAGGVRPSAYGKVKIGGDKEGKVTAYDIDCWGSSGVGGGGTVGPLPYVYLFENKRKHTPIRLNTQMQRAMRAPGHPQSCFLTDCALDDLAAKLGLDPMEVRLKNLPPNDANAVKNAPTSYPALRNTIYVKEIEIAARLSGWKDKWHAPGKGPGKGPVKHGIGMALHTWGGSAAGKNDCTVAITARGDVSASGSTQDLGTAQRTVWAIVVAEILGLKPEQIDVVIGESQLGDSTGSGGSTTCPSQAPAALRAATAARDDLFAKIAPKLGAKPEDLTIEEGKVVDKASGKATEWARACAMLGIATAKGAGSWSAAEAQKVDQDTKKPLNPNVSNVGVGGVQIAEVLVDSETGVVRCTRVVAVQDCGLIVNLQGCESQVAGGVIMGVNYALFEERIMDRQTGRQVNPNMEFYKLGGIKDMPQIVVHMHDMPERGVIGIGEPPTISTCAAVANAVFNALGVRVPETPLTPDRVLAALKGGK